MSLEAPLVTVGIPFFDEEAHLGAAVRSILAQTEADLELLLVDDGSSDRSLEIAQAFTSDPRVKVLSDGARRHLPARLNQIVRAARGTFVARMDADDVSHPTRLAKQLALLRRDSADVVGCRAALVDEDEDPFAIAEVAPLPPTHERAVARGILAHATIVARTTWFRAHPYDESLSRAEDRDLWCRTWRDSTFGSVEEVLYVVRISLDDPRFLGGYLEGQRQMRAVIRRYGPEALGLARTIRLVSASVAKSAVMRAAHPLGLSRTIVHRRGRPPTADEGRLVEEALAAGRPSKTRRSVLAPQVP